MSILMRYFVNLVALVTYRLSQLAVLGTLAVVMGEVISRYVFNSPTQSSLEITEYLIVTMGFLPMAFIHQKGGHVSVELILEVMPEFVRNLCNIASTVIVVIFSFVVCVFGADITLHAYESGIASSSLMAFPMWIAYLPIPLGFFALGMQGLVILFPSLPDGKTN